MLTLQPLSPRRKSRQSKDPAIDGNVGQWASLINNQRMLHGIDHPGKRRLNQRCSSAGNVQVNKFRKV